MAGRRERLKTATEAAHRRLDDGVARAAFLATRAGYADYLARTLRAREDVEAALDRSLAERIYPAWPQRRLAPLLREDLDDLGVAPPPERVPEGRTLGPGGILGTLYTLEGSAIGARLIARRVEALSIGPGAGARHLDRQCSEPGAFRTLIAILETTILDPEGEAECMAAALSTFERFAHAYAV